jgi:aspartate racemase
MKTIGVLGGMGPEATSYFFTLLIKSTSASRDADHVPVIVYSLPRIPDRTRAILHGGRSPLPSLVHGVEALARAGADFAVMPCVSAHYFYPGLAAHSPIPIVHLLGETAADVKKRFPGIKKVGLLSTTGTVRSGIVAEAFRPAAIEILLPDGRDQRRVMNAIYGKRGIKAGATSGAPREALLAVAADLVRRGAQGIVAGCTEVPLVIGSGDLSVPFIDPMRVTARVCIRRAGGRLRRLASSGNTGRSTP